MAKSPMYPNYSLEKALDYARAIFGADRRNPIHRDVVAKHMGYTTKSGASDKAIATMMQYGLLEKVGKGEVRVSQLAVDVLHPDKPEQRKRALHHASFTPPLFSRLKERFADDRFSSEALRSFLVREGFLDRAIGPVEESYKETLAFLEKEKATESDGAAYAPAEESSPPRKPHGGKMQTSSQESTPQERRTETDSTEPISVLMSGGSLDIRAKVDLAGLKKLRTMLEKYQSILEMMEPKKKEAAN